MAKKAFIIVLAALMWQGVATAQTSMAVPYGSFEQWTSHPAYSVTAGFVPIQVYSSFSTPTGWDYLSFPIDTTFSIMGLNVNVNTDLPLVKVSQATGTVPAGNSAVKLQSFKLSDIVSSTVYAVLSLTLDTMFTNTVFPCILLTGEVNIANLMPLLDIFLNNMSDTAALMSSLMNLNINDYFSGGIALNGFVPSYLSGSYKFHSDTSGDNGGVLLLGTRYNSTLGRREVVGGGVNLSLTDCESYTPFTVNYMSLHDLDTSFAEQTPDSLVILLVSSAGMNRQQGSYLCIDDLNLWHVDPPAPDTSGVGIFVPTMRNDDVTVFPNPANGECKVKVSADAAELRLYTYDGRLVKTVAGGQLPELSVQLPEPGVYMLHVVTRDGTAVRKIVSK